ncbi:MAG: hypothetical protein OXK78_21435, partial [Caldilineaceae bacterium]|nr:hypothetical protein [Caldilineaceae bacterium]
ICVKVQSLQSVLDYLEQAGAGPSSAPAPYAAVPVVAGTSPEPATTVAEPPAGVEAEITPPETAPPDDGDTWRGLRERVAQKRPRLLGSLEQGTVVSSQENRLTIGIREQDTFNLTQLRNPENLAAIREIGQELYGPDFQLIIQSLQDEEPSASPASAAANGGESEAQNGEQRKLAFKQAVVDIFQAVPR